MSYLANIAFAIWQGFTGQTFQQTGKTHFCTAYVHYKRTAGKLSTHKIVEVSPPQEGERSVNGLDKSLQIIRRAPHIQKDQAELGVLAYQPGQYCRFTD